MGGYPRSLGGSFTVGVKDRWRLSWQITPTRMIELLTNPNPDRARRAVEAMMRMGKLDIAELERAADGR